MDQHESPRLAGAPSEPRSALSRRGVVRTAATAAWAAPMIVAASAAPAFAASGSGNPAVIGTTIGLIRRDPLSSNDVIVPITFNNVGGPTTGMTVDVQITTTLGGINASQPLIRSTGWSLGAPATVLLTNSMDAQFIKVAPQIGGDLGPDTSSVLEFSFNGFFQNGFLNGNIAVVPTVTGADGSSAAPASTGFEVSAWVPPPPRE